jgi:hypothetical protein
MTAAGHAVDLEKNALDVDGRSLRVCYEIWMVGFATDLVKVRAT